MSLSNFLKHKILILKEQGHNQKSIADELGISQSTVSRLYKKYEITGSLEHLGGNGRPKKQKKLNR